MNNYYTEITPLELRFGVDSKEFKTTDKVMLFRHSDLDGVSTEIVTRLFFKDVYAKQCEYKNVNDIIMAFIEGGEYIHYDHIIVADISFNKEIADIIINNENLARRFMLVDHHKTALWLNDYPFSIVEVERNGKLACGTSSLFEVLYNFGVPYINENISIEAVSCFIEKVRRYDTWDWKNVYNDTDAKMLNDLFFKQGAYVFIDKMLEKLNNNIQRFMEGKWVGMFDDKELYMLAVIEKDTKNYIDKKIKLAQYGLNGDGKIYAYTLAENHISELGNEMCERLDIDFAIIIDFSKNKVSLRSKSESICDVSAIAKKLGGGGHACASGFETNVTFNKYVSMLVNGTQPTEEKKGIKQKLRKLLDIFK